MDQARDPEGLEYTRGYLWRLNTGEVQSEPGEVPTVVASELVGPDGELPPHLPTEMEAEGVPRRVCIRRNAELRKYGFTASSTEPTIDRLARGKAGRGHEISEGLRETVA